MKVKKTHLLQHTLKHGKQSMWYKRIEMFVPTAGCERNELELLMFPPDQDGNTTGFLGASTIFELWDGAEKLQTLGRAIAL